MPQVIQLTRIGESAPSKFQDIDDLMCAAFGVEPDATAWFANWYNLFCPLLACGKTFAEVRAIYDDEEDFLDEGRALTWLEENYTTESWREFK